MYLQIIQKLFSMSTIWAFDNIENKHTLSCGEDASSLSEHAINVINFEKKKVLPLTKKKELKLHQDAIECYICGKRFLKKLPNHKNYQKVRDHCHFTSKYRGAAHRICHLKFGVPSEIHVVFHNRSNYDYHFIINKLANDFEGQLEGFVENTEKYKNVSVPIETKVTNTDKDGNEMLSLYLIK